MKIWSIFIGVLLLTIACSSAQPPVNLTLKAAKEATAAAKPSATAEPTATLRPTSEPTATTAPTATAEPTATVEPTPVAAVEETAAEETAVSTYPHIQNDEGGPVVIRGEVAYSNPFFTSGVAEPIIILEDQAGFVDRNESFILPPESQTLGQITSDFFDSPFSYSLSLPIEPQGSLRDVDNDDETDVGVQIFAIASVP